MFLERKMENMKRCNQCPRGCDTNNLQCEKGRNYFENSSETHQVMESENKLVAKLIKCGKIAQHKSEKMLEHNVDENNMLDSLNENQQKELFQLLDILETKWFNDHQNRMKSTKNNFRGNI